MTLRNETTERMKPEQTLAVLKKIDSLNQAMTSDVDKYKSLIDSGLITAKKVFCGPLKVHSGEYFLSITKMGKKLIE